MGPGLLNILIAEDDDADYGILKEAFDRWIKAELPRVRDGQFAIDYLLSHLAPNHKLPDAVILDINMPRMNGMETLLKIRSIPSLAALPVIVYSTFSDPLHKKICLTAGASAYGCKGNSSPELDGFIRNFLLLLGDISSSFCGYADKLPPPGKPTASTFIRNTLYEYKDPAVRRP